MIAASRRFVCARLATYEDEAEGKFLKSLVRTRSGELENSVFAILGPDEKEQLVRPGRSMRSAYDDAKAYLDRRRTLGNTNTEALRALKRRLSDVIYRALLADASPLEHGVLQAAA